MRDRDQVALEGFTHLIPFAAGHEVIRQGRRGLTLIRLTPDLIYDRMIGVGCARKLVFSWGGNPGVGSLHRLREAVEKQWLRALDLDERSHAAMSASYAAGASVLPQTWAKRPPDRKELSALRDLVQRTEAARAGGKRCPAPVRCSFR